jgi:EAL domain-containing protein (putative c-di-GMP-specific phosphodiesterase class I)
MPDLTFLMLEQAIRDWGDLPPDYRNLNVAVNVSPSVLADDHLVVKIVELLRASDLPPERLTLEITESASLLEVPKVRTALCRLRLLGVELSLDDFGTGYSSLLALRDLPFNKVKLDRAFVTHADAQPEQLAIATSVTRLVHDLNLKLVGEGIESQQCFDLSRQIGMDYGQGFLIARPIGYNDFRQYAGMRPAMN